MAKPTASHIRIAVFTVGILLVASGVLLFRRGSALVGLLLTAVGAAAFLWASTRLAEAPPTDYEISLIGRLGYPFALGLFAVFCSAGALLLVSEHRAEARHHYLTAAVWIASVILIVAAALWAERWRPPARARLAAWWRANRREALLIGSIVLVALLVRSANLITHPYPWSGDEASIGLQARMILDGRLSNFFQTSWSSQPNWSFVPDAIAFKLFGDGILAVRLVSVLSGTLSVLCVYLLGKELINTKVGLMAAAFLALFPIHAHFSRIGVHNINDSLMVCLCLWLALRALRTGRLSTSVLSGVFTGLTLYTYVGTRFVLILVLGVFIYVALFQRNLLKQHLANLGAFLLAAFITVAPMAYFFIKNPLLFVGRIGQEGILFNGWLFDHAERTGQSVGAVLLDQFSRSTLVYIADGTAGSFFNSPRPYLNILGAILALLGMAYSFQKIRQRSHVILLAWFWSVVFFGGVLTLNPPANTRLVMTGPAVALFVALGLWRLTEALRQISVRAQLRTGLAVALLLVMAVENVLFYLVEYPNNYYFQDRNGEVAMHAGLEVDELGPNYTLYLLGAPHVFASFPTITFVAPDNLRFDAVAETLSQVIIPAGHGAFFVAIPENEGLLAEVARRFPGGDGATLMRQSVPGETLYHTYTVAPQSTSQP